MNPNNTDFEELEAPFEQTPGTNTANGSSGGCDVTVELSLEVDSYDFGKFTPPALNEYERLKEITDRLKEIEKEIQRFNNKSRPTEEEVKEMNGKADEIKSFANELSSMGFTITPLIPLPKDAGISITLTSSPSSLPGKIEVSVSNLRAGSKHLDKGLGELDPETGTTTFASEFLLSGNYGTATFTGSVMCCNTIYPSNIQRLTIDGECKDTANRALKASLDKEEAMIELACDLCDALATACAAAIVACVVAIVFLPPLVIPVGLAAIAALATALIALSYKHTLRQSWKDARKLIEDAAQPYVDSLPPC